MTQPRTGEIAEVEAGVFFTLLPPSSCRTLPYLLRPEPTSVVWLVRHMPHPIVEWVDLPVPLFRAEPAARRLRVRGVMYDLQFQLEEFLKVLPSVPASDGVLLLQMARPVPDTLDYFQLDKRTTKPSILRQNGWLLTVDLPHGGEYAGLSCPDRAYLESLLSNEVIAAGLRTGELP